MGAGCGSGDSAGGILAEGWPGGGSCAGQTEQGGLGCESGLTRTKREGVRSRREGSFREDREPLRIYRAKLRSASSQEGGECAARSVDARFQPEAGFHIEMETSVPL